MNLNPYLMFAGECESAFRFYQRCLGGEIIALMPFGEAPNCDEIAPDWHDRICHAQLRISDNVLMGSDAPPGHQERAQGFCVALNVDDPAEAERVFRALSDGGTVKMPMDETFWAQRFGMLVDRYGTPWMINCEKPQEAASL